jgi:shikimate kinase
MNIILCGLPFSGKSTYGALAAIHLKVPLLDTDKLIEQVYKQKTDKELTFRQIHKEEGEETFRHIEEEAILYLAKSCPIHLCHVISLGGGALLSEKNIELLTEMGTIIYLKTPVEVLLQRLKKQDSLPSYLSNEDYENDFRILSEKRGPHYETASHVIIDTQYLHEKEIVDAICRSPGLARSS